jgi:hypothetical protein
MTLILVLAARCGTDAPKGIDRREKLKENQMKIDLKKTNCLVHPKAGAAPRLRTNSNFYFSIDC